MFIVVVVGAGSGVGGERVVVGSLLTFDVHKDTVCIYVHNVYSKWNESMHVYWRLRYLSSCMHTDKHTRENVYGVLRVFSTVFGPHLTPEQFPTVSHIPTHHAQLKELN